MVLDSWRERGLLVGSIALPFAAAAIGGAFTASGLESWYPQLAKPWFNPPSWVFGPVWTVLYALMGISLFLVARKGWERSAVRQGVYVFGIQIILNVLWSMAFFGFQSPLTALFIILLLWAAIAVTIKRFLTISRNAAYILVPYILWVSFAAILNAAIWLLN